MPIVKVFIPLRATMSSGDHSRANGLPELRSSIKQAVAGVSALNVEPEQVSVLFLPELADEGLGEELIAEVCGLFDLPERTDRVKKDLTNAIAKALENFANHNLHGCQKVECYVASTVSPKACSWITWPMIAGRYPGLG